MFEIIVQIIMAALIIASMVLPWTTRLVPGRKYLASAAGAIGFFIMLVFALGSHDIGIAIVAFAYLLVNLMHTGINWPPRDEYDDDDGAYGI